MATHRKPFTAFVTALALLFAAGVSCVLGAQSPAAHASAQATPPPLLSPYASDHPPDLLAQTGHSQAQIDARLQATFQQLFHGDPQTQAIFYAAGRNSHGPLAYVTDVANHDVRTEGMSYGMMIAVQTGHRAEFDALWNWANTYMRITDPANPAVGYFAWSMNIDGTPRSTGPAPDGEEYFVMSLYFAANRWGSGTGIYNYKAEADSLLHLMRHHPVLTATGPFRIHPGDPPCAPETSPAKPPSPTTVGPMVNEQHGMIVFVPSAGGDGFSDPSYHLPAFYELWARWGPAEDRTFWARAARVSRRYFSQVTNPATGLSPDYANFDGTPHPTAFNPHSADFSYDSWRVISNWSVDQAWWGANPEARGLTDRLQSFLFKQGIETFPDQYTLGGKPLSTRHSAGMVSTLAVGSLAVGRLAGSDAPIARAFLDALWNQPVPSGEGRYYDGMLYMMSLLHVSGRFRIWQPREPRAPPTLHAQAGSPRAVRLDDSPATCIESAQVSNSHPCVSSF